MKIFKLHTLIVFLAVTGSVLVQAQTNLVLNPSLEDTLCCPITREDIFCAKHWYQPNPAGSSTDYYNTCNISEYNNHVLANDWLPPRTGNAYACIATFFHHQAFPNHREYLCGTLAKRLIAGKCYNVEFYVVPAFWRTLPETFFGTDRIGIWFSSDSIINTSISFDPIILTPNVEYVNGIICDSSQWTSVRGQFIALGGECHFIIGNFYQNEKTNLAICHSFIGHYLFSSYRRRLRMAMRCTGI